MDSKVEAVRARLASEKERSQRLEMELQALADQVR